MQLRQRVSLAKVLMKPQTGNNALSTLLVIRVRNTGYKSPVKSKCIYTSTEASLVNFLKTRKKYDTETISVCNMSVFSHINFKAIIQKK